MSDQSIRIELKAGSKVTHQKRHRIPLQLQKAVGADIRSLLDAEHIRRIDKLLEFNSWS